MNIGKSIAAYVTTLKSEVTHFDSFVEELKNTGSSEILSNSEQSGLKLFIGSRSGCANCHSGPLFSNKEFHNIGTGIRAKDNGRSEVIASVILDEFNCLGEYSDADPEQCMELKYVNKNKHGLSGAFKTSSLRGIKDTAPYMHDGRFTLLSEVLQHYIKISHLKSQVTDLPPIVLSEEQQADIISFLLAL